MLLSFVVLNSKLLERSILVSDTKLSTYNDPKILTTPVLPPSSPITISPLAFAVRRGTLSVTIDTSWFDRVPMCAISYSGLPIPISTLSFGLYVTKSPESINIYKL